MIIKYLSARLPDNTAHESAQLCHRDRAIGRERRPRPFNWCVVLDVVWLWMVVVMRLCWAVVDALRVALSQSRA